MRTLPLMKLTLLGIAALGLALHGTSAAMEEPKVPNMVGTWTGTSESLVLSADASGTMDTKPLFHEKSLTLGVEGQNGRRFWGTVKSEDFTESFAAVFSTDNVNAYGADEDGVYHFMIHGPDRVEVSYAHPGTGPTKSIVATGIVFTRTQP